LSANLRLERLDARVLPSQSVALAALAPPNMPWIVELRIDSSAMAHSSGGGVTHFVGRSTGEEIPQ